MPVPYRAYEDEVADVERAATSSANIATGSRDFYAKNDKEVMAARVRDLKTLFPGLGAETYVAVAARDDFDPYQFEGEYRTLLEAQARREEKQKNDDRWSGGWFSDLTRGVIPAAVDTGFDVLKGGSRWATAAGTALYQLPTAMIASIGGALDSLGGPFDMPGIEGGFRNPFAQMDLGQMIANPTSTGSGFFVGDSAAERAQMARNDAMLITDPSGQTHSFTPGRFIAHVIDPESQGVWDATSGLVDFATVLRSDPANAVGPFLRGARLARNTFRAADSANDARRAAGLWEGYRKFVHGPSVRQFLDSDDGTKLIDTLVGMDSPGAISVLFGNKVDPRVYGTLARIKDRTAMRAVLDDMLGVDIRNRPTSTLLTRATKMDSFGRSVRYQNRVDAATGASLIGETGVPLRGDYSLGGRLRRNLKGEAWRWSKRMGGGTVWLDNPQQAQEEITRMFDVAKVSYADRDATYRILANWQHEGDTYNATRHAVETIKESLIARNTKNMDEFQAEEYAEKLDAMLQLNRKTIDDTGFYWLDKLGEPIAEQMVMIGGNRMTAGGMIPGRLFARIGDGPIAANQLLNSNILLPDARQLRQQASALRRLTGNISIREIWRGDRFVVAYNPWDYWVTSPLEKFGKFWKGLMLIRIGAMMRNIGEAQASMAANGSVSLFRHPAEYMAFVMGARKQDMRLAAADFTGERWNDLFADSTRNHWLKDASPQSSRARARSRGVHVASGFVPVERQSRDFAKAWVEELMRTADDPTLNELARALRSKNPDEALQKVRDDFWGGKLQGQREMLRTKGQPRDIDLTLFDPMPASQTPTPAAEFMSVNRASDMMSERAWADGYLDQVLLDKWLRHLAIDDELLDVVHTRRYKGYDLRRRYKPRDKKTPKTLADRIGDPNLTDAEAARALKAERYISDQWRPVRPGETGGRYLGQELLQKRLQELADAQIGPVKLRHRPVVGVTDQNAGKVNPIDWAWDMLYEVPSRKLSVHPGWKRAYARALGELAPWMDDETLAYAMQYLPKRVADQIDWESVKATRATTKSRLTREQADRLAARRATDWSRETFYDVVNNNKIGAWDILRFLFPFGEAWQDALFRWSKYAARNPMMLRQIPRAIEVGKDVPVTLSGDVHLVEEDPTTGELMVNWPASKSILSGAQKLMGLDTTVDSTLQSPLGGFNMVLQALPGVGPVVTVPAALWMPEDDAWQTIRDFIFPFGEPDVDNGFWEALLPGYAQRLRTLLIPSPQQKQRLMVLRTQAAQALMAKGNYDLTKRSEQRRLEKDSKSAAFALMAVRGLAQFALPSPPKTDILLRVPKNAKDAAAGTSLVSFFLLGNEYRAMQRINPDNAVGMFLDKYGPKFFLMLQTTSYTQQYGVVPTKAFREWRRANGAMFRRYPGVAGLFGPGYDASDNQIDFTEYNRQFEDGTRRSILTETGTGFQDWLAMAQNNVARWEFEQEKLAFDREYPDATTYQRTLYFGEYRKQLVAKYPGFGNEAVLGRRRRLEVPRAIDELREMVNDPDFVSMPGSESVRRYLRDRQQLIALLPAAGLSDNEGGFPAVSTADKAWGIRAHLQRLGDWLAANDPEFRRVWDELLSQEAGIADADVEITVGG